MKIDDILMPGWIKADALKILAEIEITEGTVQLERIRAIVDGFGAGLSGTGILWEVDLIDLEALLDQAINRRIEAAALAIHN